MKRFDVPKYNQNAIEFISKAFVEYRVLIEKFQIQPCDIRSLNKSEFKTGEKIEILYLAAIKEGVTHD